MPWVPRCRVNVFPLSASVTTSMPVLSLLRFGGSVVGAADALAVVGVERGCDAAPVRAVVGGAVATPPVVDVASAPTVVVVVSAVVEDECPAAMSLRAWPPLQPTATSSTATAARARTFMTSEHQLGHRPQELRVTGHDHRRHHRLFPGHDVVADLLLGPDEI